MLFSKKTCKHCNEQYDETLPLCPFCDEEDASFKERKIPNTMCFLPIKQEVILFLVGLLGLLIAQLFFSFIFYQFEEIKQIALINGASYVVIFFFLFCTIFPFLKIIIRQFKKWPSYIYGIGYGITLIVVSSLYGLIITMCVGEMEPNLNEITAESMVTAYPLTSLIIIGVMGPLCEELTYRVGLFTFCRRFNRVLAYVVSILVFASIHFDFATTNWANELLNLPSYMLGGLILGMAYDHKGLSCSMTAHIINNVFTIILIIVRSYVG